MPSKKCPKKDEHEVRGHTRTYANGVTRKIEPHCRKNRSASPKRAQKVRIPPRDLICQPPKFAIAGYISPRGKEVKPYCRNPSKLYGKKVQVEEEPIPAYAQPVADQQLVQRVFDIASQEAYDRAVRQANRDAAFMARSHAEAAARQEVKEQVAAAQAAADKQAYAEAAKEAAAAGDREAAKKLAEEALKKKQEEEKHKAKAQQAEAQRRAEEEKAKQLYQQQQEELRRRQAQKEQEAKAAEDLAAAARAAQAAEKARQAAAANAQAQAGFKERMRAFKDGAVKFNYWYETYKAFGPHSAETDYFFARDPNKYDAVQKALLAPRFVFEEDTLCNNIDNFGDERCLTKFVSKVPKDFLKEQVCDSSNAFFKHVPGYEQYNVRQLQPTKQQKKDYRKILLAIHPDKLARRNLSEDMMSKLNVLQTGLSEFHQTNDTNRSIAYATCTESY